MARGAVLVTGASTGIGEATARRLARAGHRVYAGVRKAADGERLAAEGPADLVPVTLDVTDQGHIDATVARLDEDLGGKGLGGLVNNAGIALGGPLEYLDLEHWRRQLDVNVIGQVAVTRAALPLLRRGRGRIVFVGSISGRVAGPLIGPYVTSKFAIEGLADALRMELRDAGIDVVLIEPGAVSTPIWDKARAEREQLEGDLPAEALQRYGRAVAGIRKLIEYQASHGVAPDEVAKVIERALDASRPRARYLVGRDAKAQAVLALLPDRVKDRLILRLASG